MRAVGLELDLPRGIKNPRRCDRSICRRKGAVVASAPLSGLRLARRAGHRKVYRFNTHIASECFCGHCGIYTHHQRRFDPRQYGVNVGRLDGIARSAIPDVPVNDGVHHPADRIEA